MEFKIHNTLRNTIELSNRDIALISAPGMGLTEVLRELSQTNHLLVVRLESSKIRWFWDTEYKNRHKNKRYVLDAATIDALMKDKWGTNSLSPDDIYKTNLIDFLQSFQPSVESRTPIFIAIDDFDEMPDDLARIVCDQIKWFSDMRDQEQYAILDRIRYIIGGAVDLKNIYKEVDTVNSPPLNFSKIYPNEFLLSQYESRKLLESIHSELQKIPFAIELAIDWSGGYLHYLLEFARWISNELSNDGEMTLQEITEKLKEIVEDRDKIPLFRYCFHAWPSLSQNEILVNLLLTAISTGYVYSQSEHARKLALMGFFVEDRPRHGVYLPANKIVELFTRQRLAEMGKVLPISNSSIWVIQSLNQKAYILLLEIENRLRNCIGDILFAKHGINWMETCLSIEDQTGTNVLRKIKSRKEDEYKSIYALPGFDEPINTFFDFGDLHIIVEKNKSNFPSGFSQKIREFLFELNYHRRRIAHSRSMTIEQIKTLESRWRIIQKMMVKVK